MDAAVSVVVPFRSDGAHRAAVWAHVQDWYATSHPRWQVVAGDGQDNGPWCKAAAVASALTRAEGAVLLVADADVICDGAEAAVHQVHAGAAGWAVPHGRVYRLTQSATKAVLASGDLPDPADTAPRRYGRRPEPPGVEASYPGTVGGGLVALSRTLYEQVPLDPRFLGWGQEDEAWGHALTVMAGPPQRGAPPLWHLWHPPQPRMTRAVGSPEGYALMRRYRAATTTAAMLNVLAEIGATRV